MPSTLWQCEYIPRVHLVKEHISDLTSMYKSQMLSIRSLASTPLPAFGGCIHERIYPLKTASSLLTLRKINSYTELGHGYRLQPGQSNQQMDESCNTLRQTCPWPPLPQHADIAEARPALVVLSLIGGLCVVRIQTSPPFQQSKLCSFAFYTSCLLSFLVYLWSLQLIMQHITNYKLLGLIIKP